jgi:hypothetical protein
MSKIFLAMRGTPPPFKPPKQKGAHPPSGNPLMIYLVGGRRRKSGHFFNNISQTENSVWGLNRAFFHCLRPQKRGGQKAVETGLYKGKG